MVCGNIAPDPAVIRRTYPRLSPDKSVLNDAKPDALFITCPANLSEPPFAFQRSIAELRRRKLIVCWVALLQSVLHMFRVVNDTASPTSQMGPLSIRHAVSIRRYDPPCVLPGAVYGWHLSLAPGAVLMAVLSPLAPCLACQVRILKCLHLSSCPMINAHHVGSACIGVAMLVHRPGFQFSCLVLMDPLPSRHGLRCKWPPGMLAVLMQLLIFIVPQMIPA
jgi:hypothetical protein